MDWRFGSSPEDCGVDAPAGQVPEVLSRIAGLVYEETGSRYARKRRDVAGVEARGA